MIKQTVRKEVITINVYAPIYIKQTVDLQGEGVRNESAAMMALWFKSEVSPTGSIPDHFLLICSVTDAVWWWEHYPGESLGSRPLWQVELSLASTLSNLIYILFAQKELKP